jgi:hypothetical protein
MICDVLEKYHSFPGFTLFLGGIFLYGGAKLPHTLSAGIIASSYIIWRQGEEHILDDIGLFGSKTIFYSIQAVHSLGGISDFFSYLTELLDSPERSGTHIFDQQRYAMAAKECLQLHLCSHRDFSKGATEFACRDKAMRRSKPWEWLVRLGVHSRIRKGRRHLQVLQRQSIKAQFIVYRRDDSFPESSPKHQYYRSLSYHWALVLLPFLLEKSPVSLELAGVLRDCTFAMMAWEFPRRMRLAKEAIAQYLLRVESASAAGET